MAIAVLHITNGLYDLKHRPLTRQVAEVMYSVMLSVFLFVAGTFFVRYIDFSRLVFIYYSAHRGHRRPVVGVPRDCLAKALYRRGYGTIPFVA